MNTYKKLTKKANKLVNKLQQDITLGKKTIYENYGQKEIGKFIDKEISPLSSETITYQEKCNIKDILYKVSSIS